jgi:hypothetical protein
MAARDAAVPSIALAVAALALAPGLWTEASELPPELAMPALSIEHPGEERVREMESPPPNCPFPAVDGELDAFTGNERMLGRLWRQRHPCEALPDCRHPDRARVLVADLDDSPGLERVVANNRFGVAMFAAGGALLATWDEVGCGTWPEEEQRIRLAVRRFSSAKHPDLVVHTVVYGHCGGFRVLRALRRVGDELVTMLDLDEGGDRGCNTWESEAHVEITVPRPGEVHTRTFGRYHDMDNTSASLRYKPWELSETHCTLRETANGQFVPDDECREDY